MSLEAVLIASLLAVGSLALLLVVMRASWREPTSARPSGARDEAEAPAVRSERDAVIGHRGAVETGATGRFARESPVPRREADKALAGSSSHPRGGR